VAHSEYTSTSLLQAAKAKNSPLSVFVCKKLAERGHMQLNGFFLSVTDGYLLGVHVVRKCYANLRGSGGGGGEKNLSRSLKAQGRFDPRTKMFRSVYFPRDESFGRITSVNRDVTVVLRTNHNQFLL
jgi:hypothetical protein